MPTETVGTDSGGSMPFSDFVSELTGGIPGQSTSEPSEPASTPSSAEPAADAPPAPDGSLSTERPDAEQATPVDASETTTPPATPTEEPDPFASAKPFTYQVDGQTKTHDGIKVLETGDGWIPADQIADIGRRLGERDHLVGANQQLYQTQRTLEPLTTWTRQGPDGTKETLSGQKGLEAFHVDHAQALAENALYRQLLNSPQQLIGLLAKDGENYVIDPSAIDFWNTKIENALIKAEQETRSRLGSAVAEASKPQAQTVNFQEKGPAFIKSVAGADSASLTPEDIASLTAELPFYHIKGTNQVADAFEQRVKATIAARQQLAKVASTSSEASTRNAARLAAAKLGKPSVPVTPPKSPTPAQTRQTEQDAAWAAQQSAAAAALRRRSA